MNIRATKLVFVLLIVFSPYAVCAQTWERMKMCPGCTNVRDVEMVNADVGFASGFYVSRTTNGGQSWIPRKEPRVSAEAVAAISSQVAYAAGEFVFKTTNGGETWDKIYRLPESFEPESFLSIAIDFADEMFGGVIAPDMSVHITVDGGLSWSVWRSSCVECTAIKFVNDSTGLLVGGGNSFIGFNATMEIVQKGRESGEYVRSFTWGSVSYQFKVSDIDIQWPNHWWVVGGRTPRAPPHKWFRHMAMTTDSGRTWVEPETELPYPINAVAFADTLHGFIGDDDGDIYITRDGGRTWTMDYDGASQAIRDIEIKGETIIAVGDGNLVLLRMYPVSVWEEVSRKPLRLYPNPTTGRVRVDFGDAEAAVMTVVDMMGRTQDVARVSPNELDVSALPTGTYVVVVRRGTQVSTELLVKAGE